MIDAPTVSESSENAVRAVFLSYRRNPSRYVAVATYQALRHHGVDVFYDIENLNTGTFDSHILRHIEARPYFLPILMPGVLQRCQNPGDWVRREYEEAQRLSKTIIVLYTSEFDFSDCERYLPETLRPLIQQAPRALLRFDQFVQDIQQLVTTYLQPHSAVAVVTKPQSFTEDDLSERLQRAADLMPSEYTSLLSVMTLMEQVKSNQDIPTRLRLCSEVITLEPAYAEAWFYRGRAKYDAEDYAGSEIDYTEALARTTDKFNVPYLYYNRALSRKKLDKFAEAVEDYDVYIRIDNDDPASGYYGRGQSYAVLEQYQKAIDDFTQAIEIDPNRGAYYFQRSLAYSEIGDIAASAADNTRVLVLDPNHLDALFNRALDYMKLKRKADAIADFERLLFIAPDYKRVRRVKTLLRELRTRG